MNKYRGWIERVVWAGVMVGGGFLACSADMAELSTTETSHRLGGNEYTIIHSIVREIDMIRRRDVVINQNLNMSPERHYMTQFLVFETQGNGTDLGNNFTEG